MKNFIFGLLLVCLTPFTMEANYYFSAQVSAFDDCCIYISAGAHSGGDAAQNAWEVVIDGTLTYNYQNDGNRITVCGLGNGTHTVNFYVDGELYWTREVVITDCEDGCAPCDFRDMSPSAYQLDGCEFFFDVDYLNGGSPGYDSNECGDAMYTWDLGDGNVVGPQTAPYVFHNYAEDGTYTACVSLTVTNPEGGTCTQSECFEVIVEGCTQEEPCCGLYIDGPSYIIAPWDPCMVRLGPGGYGYSSVCGGSPVFEWDIDGDGNTDYTGTYFITSFNGPGPHTACLTASIGDCVVSGCVEVNLPDCEEELGGDGGSGRDRSAEWDSHSLQSVEVFPNPTTDYINVSLVENAINPAQVVTILDTNGKVIDARGVRSDNLISMDVSTLPAGIYFVQTQGQNGIIATERFVKR